MSRAADVATSLLSTAARLGFGGRASHPARRKPACPLELYEFEACPFCRKVREGLSAFDLDAMIYPCPRGGRFRQAVVERGGKAQFPFLVDPNTGEAMYESDAILAYLAATYETEVPAPLRLGPITTFSAAAASAWRPGHGRAARPNRPPAAPLELWSFEASPFSRLAREALCELEIPYLLHNVAGGSAARPAFVAMSGKMRVPYLKDPNTGAAMFESADIVRYLRREYGAG